MAVTCIARMNIYDDYIFGNYIQFFSCEWGGEVLARMHGLLGRDRPGPERRDLGGDGSAYRYIEGPFKPKPLTTGIIFQKNILTVWDNNKVISTITQVIEFLELSNLFFDFLR